MGRKRESSMTVTFPSMISSRLHEQCESDQWPRNSLEPSRKSWERAFRSGVRLMGSAPSRLPLRSLAELGLVQMLKFPTNPGSPFFAEASFAELAFVHEKTCCWPDFRKATRGSFHPVVCQLFPLCK